MSPRRFERLTLSLGGRCSILLSYGNDRAQSTNFHMILFSSFFRKLCTMASTCGRYKRREHHGSAGEPLLCNGSRGCDRQRCGKRKPGHKLRCKPTRVPAETPEALSLLRLDGCSRKELQGQFLRNHAIVNGATTFKGNDKTHQSAPSAEPYKRETSCDCAGEVLHRRNSCGDGWHKRRKGEPEPKIRKQQAKALRRRQMRSPFRLGVCRPRSGLQRNARSAARQWMNRLHTFLMT